MSHANVSHVLRMVLAENKGQVLTEALILGIDQSVLYYLNAVENSENEMKNMVEVDHGK